MKPSAIETLATLESAWLTTQEIEAARALAETATEDEARAEVDRLSELRRTRRNLHGAWA